MANMKYSIDGLEYEFREAHGNFFMLGQNMSYEDLQPIIDWCNKNLENIVFLDDYYDPFCISQFGDGFAYKSKEKKGIDLNNIMKNLGFSAPVFRFQDITDMMAFKLQWNNLIISTTMEGMVVH